MERIRHRLQLGFSPSHSDAARLRSRKSRLYSREAARGLSEVRLTSFTLAFRLVNCLLVQTSFVPDEYWQSLEISHRMVFKYGYETWEWKEGIRGYLYPLLFAVVYKILHVLQCDTVLLLTLLPRVLQALLAVLADVQLYNFVRKWESPEVAKWTYVCQLCSWFTWYCCTRTLTNSTEAALSVLALSFYPLQGNKTHGSWRYLLLACLAVIVRPTALIVWFPLVLHHLWREQNKLKLVTHHCLPAAAVTLAFSTLVDCVFYGKWTLVQWNFVKLNVLHGVGEFYGSHPWHWYLTQGFVVLMGAQLPLFLHGCSLAGSRLRVLLFTIAWTLLVYSFLPHKEFRFIYPLLPFCMIFCGVSLARLRSWRKAVLGVLLFLNLLPALYTGLVHQRGVLDLMPHLQRLCPNTDVHSSPGHDAQVLFLMPCHSTPLYSHVHCPIRLRFLECPPDLRGREGYVDEADLFFSDPQHWLRNSFPNKTSLPSHLVLFEPLEQGISSFLRGNEFVKQVELFHTHFPEGRLGKRILIYSRWVTRGPATAAASSD